MKEVGDTSKVEAFSHDEVRKQLLQIDAEILRLYDLPPRLERQLLDFFKGEDRAGVPVKFSRYYPEDFRPSIPLHMYISAEYQRSTVSALKKRWKPGESTAVQEALDLAVESFG